MHSLSILLPNNRLFNLESRSFSVQQAASNLHPSLKHVQRVLVFHCICTNRINGSVNQYSEINYQCFLQWSPYITKGSGCDITCNLHIIKIFYVMCNWSIINEVQWNLYNPDTFGPGKSVLFMEVSLFPR